MKIFLLLVYLFAGDLKVEKTEMKSLDACMAKGNERLIEITTDPRFVRGVFADCIEVESRTI